MIHEHAYRHGIRLQRKDAKHSLILPFGHAAFAYKQTRFDDLAWRHRADLGEEQRVSGRERGEVCGRQRKCCVFHFG